MIGDSLQRRPSADVTARARFCVNPYRANLEGQAVLEDEVDGLEYGILIGCLVTMQNEANMGQER